jgi:hypothetical protein
MVWRHEGPPARRGGADHAGKAQIVKAQPQPRVSSFRGLAQSAHCPYAELSRPAGESAVFNKWFAGKDLR